jgi:hypothetical protein
MFDFFLKYMKKMGGARAGADNFWQAGAGSAAAENYFKKWRNKARGNEMDFFSKKKEMDLVSTAKRKKFTLLNETWCNLGKWNEIILVT